VTEDGVRFETGVPVTFEYMRNRERAGHFGALYQQDIEPAGRYLLLRDPGATALPQWEFGTVSFERPLVLAFNTDADGGYDEHSWKTQLHRAYGKTGKSLSRALLKGGYDGIVTVQISQFGRALSTREIVDLSPLSKTNNPSALARRLSQGG